MSLVEFESSDPQDSRAEAFHTGPDLVERALEQRLIERSLAGDAEDFAELYLLHWNSILGTCIRRLKDRRWRMPVLARQRAERRLLIRVAELHRV